MKRLGIVFSSHLSKEENEVFCNHLTETAGVEIKIVCVENMNQLSLTQAYNLGWTELEKLGYANEIIVFCHNDIRINTKDWGKVLLGLFKNNDYDILGVAGTTELNAHGCWWLDTKQQMNRSKMFGRVWHTNGVREIESVYSERISGVQDAVVVDGLFFAVNTQTIIKRFNEDFKGFHFYDVSFSFENYLEGCNVGVIDRISVFHQSVGQTNQQWDLNRQQFVALYQDELPVSI